MGKIRYPIARVPLLTNVTGACIEIAYGDNYS